MALITAAQARAFIPTLRGTADDATLETLITRVGAAIAGALHYPRPGAGTDATVESTSYTLLSGDTAAEIVVSEDGRELYLPVRPVTAVTSVHDDPDQGYGASYLVSSSDYTIDAVRGVVRLKPTAAHGAFSREPYAIKVVCTAGFVTIPEPIKQAAILTIRHWQDQRKTGTAERRSGGQGSVELEPVALPRQATDLLAEFVLPHRWAA